MFPEYKKYDGKMFFFERKQDVPDGWEDGGKTGRYEEPNYSFRVGFQIHEYCGEILHVGRENGEMFKFCPKCLVKI